MWGDASEPGVRRVPAGACGALRVPAAGAAVGDPAQGKNINMLYSAQLASSGHFPSGCQFTTGAYQVRKRLQISSQL